MGCIHELVRSGNQNSIRNILPGAQNEISCKQHQYALRNGATDDGECAQRVRQFQCALHIRYAVPFS